jgi:hypothetical protein
VLLLEGGGATLLVEGGAVTLLGVDAGAGVVAGSAGSLPW